MNRNLSFRFFGLVSLALFLWPSFAQAQYIGFDGWQPHVNNNYGYYFDNVGDQLTSKTTIELINGSSNQTLTGTVKLYRDGVLKTTIDPVTMTPNSNVSLSGASVTIIASADAHVIRADVTIKNAAGNTISSGTNEHQYRKRSVPNQDADTIIAP